MRVTTEEAQSVTLEVSLEEAGHIAADILSKESAAGKAAVAVAHQLQDQGLFLKPVVSDRTEWAGPDKLTQ
ncbi:MAG: hypothetical protein ACYDEV_01585 [Acidiferrobacter sp.]